MCFIYYWCTTLGIPAMALQAFNLTNLLGNLALAEARIG